MRMPICDSVLVAAVAANATCGSGGGGGVAVAVVSVFIVWNCAGPAKTFEHLKQIRTVLREANGRMIQT